MRILHGLASFQSPGLVPGDVPLEPTDTLLGVLAVGKHTAAVLLDCGAYLRIGDDWQLVLYGAIEARLPPQESSAAPLALITPVGTAEILSGTADLWEVGRFFMTCAEDANAA
jgi:hypothetical protein